MLRKLTNCAKTRPVIRERKASVEPCYLNCQSTCADLMINSATLQWKLNGM